MKNFTEKEIKRLWENKSLQECKNCDHGRDGVCRKLDTKNYGKLTWEVCEYWYPPVTYHHELDKIDLLIMYGE